MAKRRRPDAARAADEVLLARRLAEAGWRSGVVVAHENRTVVVHRTRAGLRVHRGFAYAPDSVLRAIVTFLDARPVAARRAAERELLAFPVHAYVPRKPRRALRRRAAPGDRAMVATLEAMHAELNRRHFGGRLRPPTFRLSGRMRSRLGEVRLPDGEGSVEIGISRRHLAQDGWDEARQTLLHEMVHQWQVESGLPLNHGPAFRRMAREVGVEAASRRSLG